jgi:hypothetical protein
MKYDKAYRDARMLVPKFSAPHDGRVVFHWPNGSVPIWADTMDELIEKVAERLRKERAAEAAPDQRSDQ